MGNRPGSSRIAVRAVALSISGLMSARFAATAASASAPPTATPMTVPAPPTLGRSPLLPTYPRPERWLSVKTLHDFYDEVLLFFHVVGAIAWVGLLLATIALMGAAAAWLRADAARRQRVP